MLVFALPRKGQSQRSKKVDFLKSSRSGIKQGRTNHSASMHLVGLDRKLAHNRLHIQNKKTCKNQLQITKEKIYQNSKRMCLTDRKLENVRKSKITLLSTAALLQHRKNREIFVPFAFPRLSQAQEGEPRKGSKLCALFPPHLLRSTPGCTLRRNVTQDDSQ